MKINESVAAALDYLTQIVCHATVWIHIEQDGSRVPDQAIGPTRDDAGPDDAYRRVYPEARANSKPTITSTDTVASAITCITAACMLLSRSAAPCV